MSALRIFAMPVLCAVLMLAGLILSLVADGWTDIAGGLAIAAPLLLAALRTRQRPVRNRERSHDADV